MFVCNHVGFKKWTPYSARAVSDLICWAKSLAPGIILYLWVSLRWQVIICLERKLFSGLMLYTRLICVPIISFPGLFWTFSFILRCWESQKPNQRLGNLVFVLFLFIDFPNVWSILSEEISSKQYLDLGTIVKPLKLNHRCVIIHFIFHTFFFMWLIWTIWNMLTFLFFFLPQFLLWSWNDIYFREEKNLSRWSLIILKYLSSFS